MLDLVWERMRARSEWVSLQKNSDNSKASRPSAQKRPEVGWCVRGAGLGRVPVGLHRAVVGHSRSVKRSSVPRSYLSIKLHPVFKGLDAELPAVTHGECLSPFESRGRRKQAPHHT